MRQTFDSWFDNKFQLNLDCSAPYMISENKTQLAKYARMKEISKMILENPDSDIQEMRRKIALRFFVTMRTALDYLNYAKLIVVEYKRQNRKT